MNYGTGRHTHIVYLPTNNIKEKDEYVFHVTINKFAKFKDYSEATPATLTSLQTRLDEIPVPEN